MSAHLPFIFGQLQIKLFKYAPITTSFFYFKCTNVSSKPFTATSANNQSHQLQEGQQEICHKSTCFNLLAACYFNAKPRYENNVFMTHSMYQTSQWNNNMQQLSHISLRLLNLEINFILSIILIKHESSRCKIICIDTYIRP